MIGAGPAGLTYASLVADRNKVTVFEREGAAGGAFRQAGKAPLFQDVVANEQSFDRYVRDLVAACTHKGVTFRHGVDVAQAPDELAPFDRIVSRPAPDIASVSAAFRPSSSISAPGAGPA